MAKPSSLKNKVAIITGASSGIGKALAFEFANQGAKVVLAARRADKLQEVEKQLLDSGGEAFAVVADVSVEKDCEKLIRTSLEKYGRIDMLINNAGISMRALFADVEMAVIKKLMQINFWGTVYCSKFALPHLLESKGTLVGVSSIAGYVGLPARTAYSASKFAMHGFLEALRTENLEKGLKVLIACPGFTASNIRNSALTAHGDAQGESPRKEEKMMSAEEVAQEIIKAINQEKQSLILTLEGKMAVFLKKIWPKLIQKLVFNKLKKEANSPLMK